jgi:hypothetical protein
MLEPHCRPKMDSRREYSLFIASIQVNVGSYNRACILSIIPTSRSWPFSASFDDACTLGERI